MAAAEKQPNAKAVPTNALTRMLHYKQELFNAKPRRNLSDPDYLLFLFTNNEI